MEINGGNNNQPDKITSTHTNQQLKQTTKAKQKATSKSVNGGGKGAGGSSSSNNIVPLAEGTLHVLTTSNGSPYQSKLYTNQNRA